MRGHPMAYLRGAVSTHHRSQDAGAYRELRECPLTEGGAMAGKPCTYCPEPDADACVRSHRSEDGQTTHVYACRECMESRGLSPLYRFIKPADRRTPATGGAS